MKEVWFFPNGNTAVTEGGEQIPELQQPWILQFARFLESEGVNPLECIFHLQSSTAKIFVTSVGDYNWRFDKVN